MPFQAAKETYQKAREEQRKKLHDYMSVFLTTSGHFLNGYSAIFGGSSGKGIPNYTNNGSIANYNFSNWKWLTFKKVTSTSNKSITVYFQSPNYDARTNNSHSLFDRLSFDFSEENSGVTTKTKIFVTDIDLPLNNSKMASLLSIMDKEIGPFAK